MSRLEQLRLKLRTGWNLSQEIYESTWNKAFYDCYWNRRPMSYLRFGMMPDRETLNYKGEKK